MTAAAPSGAPRVAVVAGTPALVRAARDLGVRTALVHDAAAPVPECAKEADETIPVDLADPEDLHRRLAAAHAEDPFDRVLSLTEPGLVPAAEAAEQLALRGNPLATVVLLKDKRRMRELLNGAGLSPTAVSAPGDAAALAAFCRTIGGPAVLKPANGSASRAVVRVDGADDAERAWNRFVRLGGADPLAEQYLDGPEVSVETFTHAGRHLVVAVTGKAVWPSFVEAGHTMPAALEPAERERAETLVRDFLDLVGLREGPAHTELRLTADGPRIIESHNRIGGDKIRELVRRCYGLDLPALTV
ncbi:ATP-grasp domain-containing protein, partial [Glycomyces tenuis]